MKDVVENFIAERCKACFTLGMYVVRDRKTLKKLFTRCMNKKCKANKIPKTK